MTLSEAEEFETQRKWPSEPWECDYARLRANSARDYQAAKDYTAANVIYAEALALCRGGGCKGSGCSDVLCDVAEAYQQQGRLAEAEDLYKQALEYEGRFSDKVYPVRAWRFAAFYNSQGRTAEADSVHAMALEVASKLGGMDYFVCADMIANDYERQNRSADAAAIRERLLKDTINRDAGKNGSRALAVFQLASAYRDRHQGALAEQALDEGLKIPMTYLGVTEFEIIRELYTFADSFTEQGKYDLAERIWKYILDVDQHLMEKHDGSAATSPHVKHAKHLVKLGDLYALQGRSAEAENVYGQAVQLTEDNPLGFTDLKDALSNAKRGLDALRSLPGKN